MELREGKLAQVQSQFRLPFHPLPHTNTRTGCVVDGDEHGAARQRHGQQQQHAKADDAHLQGRGRGRAAQQQEGRKSTSCKYTLHNHTAQLQL